MTLYDALAAAIGSPSSVWCRTCGRSVDVDARDALENGWPECHGETMTMDPPETWAP